MPLAYSEITSNSNENKIKRKGKRKTIKKKISNKKVENFLNSMNSKEEFEPQSAGRDRMAGASTRRSIRGYDSDEEDEFGEPYVPEAQKEQPSLVSQKRPLDNNQNMPLEWDKDKLESFGLLREGLKQQENYQKEQARFYNKYIPTYTGNAQNISYYSQLANSQEVSGSRDELMRKLNYVVHMLEEQHDEKTGNVTEELVLYMFLGVFVIFVVDSFAKAGKYTR